MLKQSIIFLPLFTCLFFISTIIQQPSFAQSWTDDVDKLFEQWDNDNSAGGAIAIVHEGNVVFKTAYGMSNFRYEIPNTTTTVFRAASNSKQFTAFAILLLEDDGLLSLDDDIRDYLPDVPDFGHTITIRHLLHHTSGLRDFFQLMLHSGWNLFEDKVTKEAVLRLVSRQQILNFEPGEKFVYSNTGYVLLAEIVEKISGQTFTEFTTERIFEPLGMENSYFIINNNVIVKNMADGYINIEGDNIYIPIHLATVGEAGLQTTVEDLVKWDQNFYNLTVGNQTIIDKMHEKMLLNSGNQSPLSMGLIVEELNGNTLVHHGGDLGGYHGNIVRFPDHEFSVITLANDATLNSGELLNRSIQAFSIYLNANTTGIDNSFIHEPSLAGWGLNNYDLDMDWTELFIKQQLKLNTKTVPETDKITPSDVRDPEQYLGRYYSEELEVFYNLELDEDNNIAFKSLRLQPHFITANRVARDRIIFKDLSDLSGNFLRNDDGEVSGYQISDPRAFNITFKKVEAVVTK